MSKIWYCTECGYEADRGGRCHNCDEFMVPSPLAELGVDEVGEEVGYRLGEWEDQARGELISGLIFHQIRHRFEGDELVVAATDEERTDKLVEELTAPAGSSLAEVEGAESERAILGALRDAAWRLSVDPTDMIADADTGEVAARLFLIDELPGVTEADLAAIGRVTRRLLGALGAEEAMEAEIVTQASVLVRLLDPIIATGHLAARLRAETAATGGEVAVGAVVETGAGFGDAAGTDNSPTGEVDIVRQQIPAPYRAGPVRIPNGTYDDPGGDDGPAPDEVGRGDAGAGAVPAGGSDEAGVTDAEGDNPVYDMSGWLPEQRTQLALLLESGGVSAEWDGDDLIVDAEHEAAVDAMFDEIGGLDPAGGDGADDDGGEQTYHDLEELFGVVDRLVRDPGDPDLGDEFLALAEPVAVLASLTGVDQTTWWSVKTQVRILAESISGREAIDLVRRQATELRTSLRSLV
jgi:hypothetical protein